MLATQSATNHIKRCKPLLGTYVEVSVSSESDDNALLDITEYVFSEIQRIENLMSFHNPDSELSYVNREAWECILLRGNAVEEIKNNYAHPPVFDDELHMPFNGYEHYR